MIYKSPNTIWVAALCGAFVTFMSKIESLAELSLGPVKAKMKETIREATASIENLQKVATVTSKATLTDLMAGGFMGGMRLEKRLELHDEVIESLKEIGASQEQLAEAESDWKKGIAIVYHRAIRKAVEERKHPNRVNPEASEAQKNAGKEIKDLLDFENWAVPSPHQIKVILKKYNIDSTQVNKWIEDYDHFLKTNDIRNREEFIKQ